MPTEPAALADLTSGVAAPAGAGDSTHTPPPPEFPAPVGIKDSDPSTVGPGVTDTLPAETTGPPGWFRLTADASFNAVLLHEGGLVRYGNAAFGRRFGYSPLDFADLTVADLFVGDVWPQLERTSAVTADAPLVATAITQEGSHFPVAMTVATCQDGQRVWQILTLRDMTVEQELERALAENQVERLSALIRLGQSVNRSLELSQVLHQILSEIDPLLDAASFAVLLREGADELVVAASTDPGGLRVPGARVLMVEDVAGLVIQTGRAQWISRSEQLSTSLGSPALETANSILAVPILVGDDVLAVLEASHPAPAHFSSQDLKALQIVAHWVALAIKNVRAYEQARAEISARTASRNQMARFAVQLATAAQISAELSEILHPETLLDQLVCKMQQRFELYHVHIYVLEPDTEMLFMQAGSGIAGRQMRHQTHQIPLAAVQSLVARAARSRQIITVNDVRGHTGFLPNPLLPDTRAEVAIPLIADDQVLGVLDVQDRRPDRFGQADIDSFRSLAGVVAIALRNARLFQELGVARDEMARYNRALKSSNDELQQFAYVAAHDLKEPIRMVTSYLRLLSRRYEGRLDDEAQQFIQFAIDGVGRMKTLIDDFIDYARVSQGQREFLPISTELLLEEALARLKLTVAAEQVAVQYESLPVVQGDPPQLASLFYNLISNAIKYRRQEPPRIAIAARREDDRWHFSVADNGIGIPEQFHDRIFRLFQRLHTRSEFPGTGIGLAMCKKIVERHGGSIWLTSRVDRGSTFHFTLPTAD